MTTEEEKAFYNECMDCRTTRDGTIESDDMGEFFRLVNEYADNKYRLIIGGMKCSGNCTHDDTRIRCEETEQWCKYFNGDCPCTHWEYCDPNNIDERRGEGKQYNQEAYMWDKIKSFLTQKWVIILAWVLWIVATADLILQVFTTIHNC